MEKEVENDDSVIEFTLSKVNLERSRESIDKKRILIPKIFDYALKFEYERNIDIMKTQYNDKIIGLIEEIKILFEINNLKNFDFYVKTNNKNPINLLCLKLLEVDSLFNPFENECQVVKILIIANDFICEQENLVKNNNSKYTIKKEIIFTKKDLIQNLRKNFKTSKGGGSSSEYILKENSNFKLNKSIYQILCHFNNNEFKFMTKDDLCSFSAMSYKSSYVKSKFYSLSYRSTLKISLLSALQELVNPNDNIHLILSMIDFNKESSKQLQESQINLKIKKLKLTFLDSKAIERLTNYEFNTPNLQDLIIKLDFQQNDIFDFDNILKLLKKLKNNSNELNLSLNFNANFDYTKEILLKDDDYSNCNLRSLKIKDILFSISKNFSLGRMLSIFSNFNLDYFSYLKLKDFKFTSPKALFYVLVFISLVATSLNTLIMKDNRIEYQSVIPDYKLHIQIDKEIIVVLDKQCVNLQNLNKLYFRNSSLLKINDIGKCSKILEGRNLKFDKNSLIESQNKLQEYPVDNFCKKNINLSLELNSKFTECFFENKKIVPTGVTRLIIKDFKLNSQNDTDKDTDTDYSFSFFENGLKESLINYLEELKFIRCIFRTEKTLEKIILMPSIRYLKSLSLDSIYKTINLTKILKPNSDSNLAIIDSLTIKNSFIKMDVDNCGQIRIFKNLKINIQFLEVIDKVISTKEEGRFENTINSIKNLLENSQIRNLTLTNEIFKYVIDKKIEVHNFTNLILKNVEINHEIFEKLLVIEELNFKNLVILKSQIPKQIFKGETPPISERLIRYSNKIKKLHIDYASLSAFIFNQPNINSFMEYLNQVTREKDLTGDIENEYIAVSENFSILNFFFDLTLKGSKVNIYYENKSQLNELKIILFLKDSEIFKNLKDVYSNSSIKKDPPAFLVNNTIISKNAENKLYLVDVKDLIQDLELKNLKNFNIKKLGKSNKLIKKLIY